MFLPFLYALRRRKVPVGTTEAVALAQALGKGLHDSSLEGFYEVARALLVHSETHLDAFDDAFGEVFRGVEGAGLDFTRDLLEWLKNAKENPPTLTPEERALFEAMSIDELEALLRQRLEEQNERHDGGAKWIGTGGKSPFGHSGAARKGIRIGGPGGNRSAVRVADARMYQGYRGDLILDTRQLTVALRKLRAFAREGHDTELDLDGTIEKTAKNAGELEIVTRPPRRPNTRVILMMDVGGSMDPYAELVSRLFSAAKKATHFKELRTYYFHNCIYGRVFSTAGFRDPVSIDELLAQVGRNYKLILVGDALMGPYELVESGGALGYGDPNGKPGIEWLMTLREHFRHTAWLNPLPRSAWYGETLEQIRHVFDMFPLTLDGLTEAVNHLIRSGK